jgi:hypothetical protein
MSLFRSVRVAFASGALLAAALGCGLLEEATTATVATDWYNITVDSNAMGIAVPTGSTVPAVPCSAGCETSGISCGGGTYGCEVQCGGNSNCEIEVTAEVAVTVDLSKQIKNQFGAKALSKVSLSQAFYRIADGNNTLNFDTPKIELFIGPNSANKTSDAGVVPFATLPTIKGGEVFAQKELQDITSAGSQALSGFVLNYQTPFKFLVKTTLKFASGQALPQGRIALELKAFLKVTPIS